MSHLEARRRAIARALTGGFPAQSPPHTAPTASAHTAPAPAPTASQRCADAVAVAALSDSVGALARRLDTLTDGLADIRRDLRASRAASVGQTKSTEVSIPERPVPEEPAEDEGPRVSVPPLRLDRQNSAAFEVLLGSGRS